MKKQKGITLIALVISIIVMLILAGVSINAVIGDNGVLSRAQYSTFLNEMAAVEEAVGLWKAGELIDSKGEITTAIPANGLCKANELTATERLVGEIGYYRTWSIGETMPSTNILSSASDFNSAFESEMVFYPAGVQDLYYLNNEALGLKDNKVYLIDASTSMVYSMTGISLNGVRCYSSHMAKAVMGGVNTAPLFAEAEVSGTGSGEVLAGNVSTEYLMDENGNYIDEYGNVVTEANRVLNPDYNPNGFQIIADSSNDNVYKLYNNGDLYGKGVKDFSFNYTDSELDTFDSLLWQELTIPDNIGPYKEVYQGSQNIFVIDNEGYLWAWGINTYNQLGLTKDQQVDYTGREAIKLNVDNKKVKKIWQTDANGKTTFVLTEDNCLYGAGGNTNNELGLGHTNSIMKFSKVELRNIDGDVISADKIYRVYQAMRYTVIQINQSNYEVGTDEWYNANEFYIAGYNNNNQFSLGSSEQRYYYFTRVWDGYIYNFDETQMKSVRTTTEYNSLCDVDNKIDNMIVGNATKIITKDGTMYYTGYNTYAGRDGGNANVFTLLEYTEKEKLQLNDLKKICEQTDNSSSLIWKHNNGVDELIGSNSRNGDEIIGIPINSCEKGYYYKINLPSEITDDGIKDVSMTISNTYILTNSGNLYVTGLNKGLGLGRDDTRNINDTYIQVNINKKIKTINNSYGMYNFCVAKCEDGTLYAIGNSQIILRDKILQTTWKYIASNVREFIRNSETAAYVTKDNNLFVAGTDSYILGLGIDELYSVNQYLEVTSLSGKAKELQVGYGIIGVKTTDNKLLVSGYHNIDSFQYNGLEKSVNKFEELLADVGVWNIKHNTRYAVSNNKLYEWGETGDNDTLIKGTSSIPKEVTDLIFDINKLNKIDTDGDRKTIFLVNGEVYTCSYQAPSWYGGQWGIHGDTGSGLRKFTFLFDNNKVINTDHASVLSSIYLTDDGSVYTVGTKSYLGIGETDFTTYTHIPEKSNIENIIDIVAGNGFYIAITSDGKVYGTGSNQYGILGRWIGVDRNSPNSRYKTAFEWVECPELEI